MKNIKSYWWTLVDVGTGGGLRCNPGVDDIWKGISTVSHLFSTKREAELFKSRVDSFNNKNKGDIKVTKTELILKQ